MSPVTLAFHSDSDALEPPSRAEACGSVRHLSPTRVTNGAVVTRSDTRSAPDQASLSYFPFVRSRRMYLQLLHASPGLFVYIRQRDVSRAHVCTRNGSEISHGSSHIIRFHFSRLPRVRASSPSCFFRLSTTVVCTFSRTDAREARLLTDAERRGAPSRSISRDRSARWNSIAWGSFREIDLVVMAAIFRWLGR